MAVKLKELKTLESKWGKQTMDVSGWTAIPNILLDRQQALGIDPVKLNILLVLLKHWWEKPKMPYPSKATIAEIIGKEASTVQRHIRKMEKDGLLTRRTRFHSAGGQTSNEYDLSGLVSSLKQLAKKEMRTQVGRKKEDARKRRGNVK